jgi:phosphomevalonate kinase
VSAPPPPLTLSAPGNLLLMGEYAVLEEGGLGLALAVEPRVRLQAWPALRLQVESSWPGSTASSPFVEAAVQAAAQHLGRPCTGALHVDSSAFFSPGGRKTGLGSSAAVTVSLVCALLSLGGRPDTARSAEAARLAVRAHRLAQQGRGSGYDVLASFHGGFGMFRGGDTPAWEPCRLPAGVKLLLVPGPAPVSTAEAVRLYRQWKSTNPSEARDFLRDSNDNIQTFLRSPTVDHLCRALAVARGLGTELGRLLGVPAELAVPGGLDPRWCKALGAGNELGLCLLPPGAGRPAGAADFWFVRPAETGVSWAE